MGDRVLEAREIFKTFEEGSQRVEVLKGVSIDVEAGEGVALEGPSGSGQTPALSSPGVVPRPPAGRVAAGL